MRHLLLNLIVCAALAAGVFGAKAALTAVSDPPSDPAIAMLLY
jgi:hypothetical protein